MNARSNGMSAPHLVFARLQGWAGGKVLVNPRAATAIRTARIAERSSFVFGAGAPDAFEVEGKVDEVLAKLHELLSPEDRS